MNVTDLPRRMQNKIQVTDADCWEWQGCRTSRGYGQVSVQGRSKSSHRVAYELLVGPIPEELQIDHLCRNKPCCNPAHLEPVTALVNVRRRPDINKSHCVHGHEMTPSNTIVIHRASDGYTIRNCRTCVNAAKKSRPVASPNVLADGDPRHGTTNGYSYFKCRCADCRRSYADYMREYRRKRTA